MEQHSESPGSYLGSNEHGKKLDWMYKSPTQMVNREEYLLGRPIDKSFEQMAQTEKNPAQNHVEHECVPPSLRFFSGNEQVDLVRKMQEDPLYAIKKKEMETRSQLLKNPVKLKQLRQLLEQQSQQTKEKKSSDKGKSKKNSEHPNEAELELLLISKFRYIKSKISEKHLTKFTEKIRRKSKKQAKRNKMGSNSDIEQTNLHTKSLTKPLRSSPQNYPDRMRRRRPDYAYDHKIKADEEHDGRKRLKNYHPESRVHRENSSSRSRHRPEMSNERGNYFTSKSKHRQQLSEEEKIRRREEMIANAAWRDKEREKNVKQYSEAEMKELNNTKNYDSDFIRKHLAATAEIGTVASRIKSNINNIQRSGRSMNTNFAKR